MGMLVRMQTAKLIADGRIQAVTFRTKTKKFK